MDKNTRKNLRNVSSFIMASGLVGAAVTGVALSPLWLGIGVCAIVKNCYDNADEDNSEDG